MSDIPSKDVASWLALLREPTVNPTALQEIGPQLAAHIEALQTSFQLECEMTNSLQNQLSELRRAGETSDAQLHNRPEVMNPPQSAAEGCEAGNLNMGQRHGLGASPRAAEARPAEVAPLPSFGDPCPCCASGKIGQSGYDFRCANCGWLGSRVPWAPVSVKAKDDPLAGVRWICSACTTVNGIDDEKCLGCRKPREEKDSRHPKTPSAQPASASTGDDATPSRPSPSPVECPKCRTQLAFDGDVCGLCSPEVQP